MELYDNKKTEEKDEDVEIKEELTSEQDNNTIKQTVAIEAKEDILEKIAKEGFKQDITKEYEEVAEEFKSPKKKKITILVVSIILTITLIILSIGLALLNINNSNIILGVKANNIVLSKLSKQQATEKLEQEMLKATKQEIKIKVGELEYLIVPTEIEIEYNVKKTIEEAYSIGRNNNILKNNLEILKSLILKKQIDIEFKYNEELLDNILKDISGKLPNSLIETGYYIEEDKLIIKRGKTGNSIDNEQAKELIVEKLKNNDGIEIILVAIQTNPQEIDIEKIYKEIYSEPKDAYYTTEPFEIFPQVNGVDFDIQKAKEILKENKEEYEIPLIIKEPKIKTTQIGSEAFPDLLSTFSTRYDAKLVDRSTNLRLAAERINGTVVLPDEIFSYNKTVGERTIAKGYKQAAGYAGGKVVQTLGGGICQISSTLYDAAVYANLKIISRANHMFTTSYIGAGKDATVVYGAIDFKFKNTRSNPIMLKTSVKNGVATISIYGIKEPIEYEVEISTQILSFISYGTRYEDDPSLEPGTEKVTQNGMRGCKSITYKILKQNGVEVSKEVLSTDTYDPMHKIISRGPKKVVEETEEPIVIPTPEPTQEPNPEPTPDPEPTQDPEPDLTPDPQE